MVTEEQVRTILAPPGDSSEDGMREHASGYHAMSLEDETVHGLPFSSLEALIAHGIPRAELLRILMMPERTYARRKREQVLSPDESDRTVRVARVIAFAEEVLESRAKAVQWLLRESGPLGRRPVDLLVTDIGTSKVENALNQLEYGVYV